MYVSTFFMLSCILQAKKSGQEPPPQDAMEFERATQELAIFQKQLDQARKQNRQHQMLTQEYRSKQQVSLH